MSDKIEHIQESNYWRYIRHLENNSWLDDAQRCILSTLFIPGFPWYTVECKENEMCSTYNSNENTDNSDDISSSKHNNKVNTQSLAVMRYVIPYDYTLKVFVKGRWVNQTLLSVYSSEFAHHPRSFYETCIRRGRLRCVPKQRLQQIMSSSNRSKKCCEENNCGKYEKGIGEYRNIQKESVAQQHNIKRRNVKREWREEIENYKESIPVEQRKEDIARSITERDSSRNYVNGVCSSNGSITVAGGDVDKCSEDTRNDYGGVDTISNDATTVQSSFSKPNTILHHGDVVLHTIHRHEISIPLCSSVIGSTRNLYEQAINHSHVNSMHHRACVNICSVQIKEFGVIVINKPAGLPTHATGRYFYNSLLNMLEYVLAPKRLHYWLFGNAPCLCNTKSNEECEEVEEHGVMRKRCRQNCEEQQQEQEEPIDKCVSDDSDVNECHKLQNSLKTCGLSDAQAQCVHVLLQSLVSTSNLSNAELIELYEYYNTSHTSADSNDMESVPLDKAPRPCYRLDRVTSGVIICAVSRNANSNVSKLLMYKSLHAEQYFRSLLTHHNSFCTGESKLLNETTVQNNFCKDTCQNVQMSISNDKRLFTGESKTSNDINTFFTNFSDEYSVCKRYLAKVEGDFNIAIVMQYAQETEQASEKLQLHLILLDSSVLENINSTCDNALMQERLLECRYRSSDHDNSQSGLKKSTDRNVSIKVCKYETEDEVMYPNGLLVCTEQSVTGPESNISADCSDVNVNVEQQTSNKAAATNKWEKDKTIWSISLFQKLYTLQTNNNFLTSSSESSCLSENNEVGYQSVSSVLLCTPLTGRLHQIRLHLQQIGYPIIGDTVYGYCKLKQFNWNSFVNKQQNSISKKEINNHTKVTGINTTTENNNSNMIRCNDSCNYDIYFNNNELPTHYKENWWSTFAGTASCQMPWCELPLSSTATHTNTSSCTTLADDDAKCNQSDNDVVKLECSKGSNTSTHNSAIDNEIDYVLCYECAHKLPVASFTDNCSSIALHAWRYSIKTSALRSNTVVENNLENTDQSTSDDWTHFASLTLPQWVHKEAKIFYLN